VARIQQRKRDGLSHEQLAAEFKVSRGSITNALKMPAPELPIAPAGAATASAAASAGSATVGESSDPAEPTDGGSAPLDEIRSTLTDLVRTLNGVVSEAKERGDKGVLLTFGRASIMALKELGRFTPPAPPDHEDSPDMRAAAEQFRRDLHTMIDREIKRRRLAG
jgi:hypothetical protein